MYEISGNVHLVAKEKVFSDKFKKRDLVLVIPSERNLDWDNYVKIEFVNDKTSMLDGLSEGDKVVAKFFVNGRKWQKDKDSEQVYFTSLRGAEVDKVEESGDTLGDTTYTKDVSGGSAKTKNNEPEPITAEDDLPF